MPAPVFASVCSPSHPIPAAQPAQPPSQPSRPANPPYKPSRQATHWQTLRGVAPWTAVMAHPPACCWTQTGCCRFGCSRGRQPVGLLRQCYYATPFCLRQTHRNDCIPWKPDCIPCQLARVTHLRPKVIPAALPPCQPHAARAQPAALPPARPSLPACVPGLALRLAVDGLLECCAPLQGLLLCVESQLQHVTSHLEALPHHRKAIHLHGVVLACSRGRREGRGRMLA